MKIESIKMNCVVVCGPTASGKTRLGVEIARRFSGEIISADSRQVYRGMDIGTGKDLAEYSEGGPRVPYHLIDIADPADIYTVYNYKRDFGRVFREIIARRKTPVVAGGTGLYLEAVLRDYDIPAVLEDAALREQLMLKDQQALLDELARAAPDLYQSVDRSSKKRIVRSLEIAKYRNQYPLDDSCPPVDLRPVVLGVLWERSQLKERIRERLEARFKTGMVDEVRHLAKSGIPRERIAMFGMEYKRIAAYIYGDTDYDAMFAALLHDIEQLSKRQSTWFRGMERRGVKICWIHEAGLDQALAALSTYTFEAQVLQL